MNPMVQTAPTDGAERSDDDAQASPGGVAPTRHAGRYGLDAPLMLAVLGGLGVLFASWGAAVAVGSGVGAAAGPWLASLLCLLALGAMVRSSLVVKPRIWDGLLDDLDLTGRERALDLGCGRGLVTVSLAGRLASGSVVGADIWRSRDQTGNSVAEARRNLERAGVSDRAELVEAPLVDLPFDDGEFDVVTASLSLHCLPLARERGEAMRELMRVTRPGGRVVILDVGKTFEFEAWLNDAGWHDVSRRRAGFAHYPVVRTVTARKPRGRGRR